MEVKKFEDPSGDVWKYVFEFGNAIAEAVLYRYGSFHERTVMCVSVQSGCPVGCLFCGTGKKFIRNLTWREITRQVEYLVDQIYDMEDFDNGIEEDCNKFQIMFMSMGEPMLNWDNVKESINYFNQFYSNAQLLLSTIGVKDNDVLNEILVYSRETPKMGLQFSIHEAFDISRNALIPFKNKLSLRQIRDYGIMWNNATDRKVYLNYCVTPDNSSISDRVRLMDLFPPTVFAFTFSVICEKEEGKQSSCDMTLLKEIQAEFIEAGYNTRIFDPAGKDTIGGGCGQLWYIQDYFKNH